MKINKINKEQHFGARIKINKHKLMHIEELTADASLLGATTSSIAGGSGLQTTAVGPALHISQQTPQIASIPEFSAQYLPHSVWNFLHQLIKPELTVKEDAAASSYSSALGTFLQRFGSSGYDSCEFGKNSTRKFPS